MGVQRARLALVLVVFITALAAGCMQRNPDGVKAGESPAVLTSQPSVNTEAKTGCEGGGCGEQEPFVMGFMLLDEKNPFDNELTYALDAGAGGVRAPFWYLGGNFRELGAPTDKLAAAGFEVIANAQPMPPGPPGDYSQYKRKLRALVESKKETVRYWQIGNEPDLAWTLRGYGADDYVNFFVESESVIREACPDCRIALAGISNQYDSSSGNYEFYRQVLEGIRKRSPSERPFEVFDVHLYTDDGDYGRAARAVADYRRLLSEAGFGYDIEFVSTEVGTYSGKPKSASKNLPFQSEEFQAKMLVKLYTELFSAGVTKAFWTNVINVNKFGVEGQEGGFFDLVGLVYNGNGSYDRGNNIACGTKKQAYTAYKNLASKIRGKTKCETVAENVYKFSKGDEVVYVAWNDAGGRLPPEVSGRVLVTDYAGNQKVKETETITLDDNPIFIEKQ